MCVCFSVLDIGHHHHLIMNHAPQSQSIAQVNLAVQSSLPVSITPIITMSSQLASVPPFNHAALHPLPIQLGSQPTPVPMPAPPVVGLVPQPGSVQHPSFQAVYSPVGFYNSPLRPFLIVLKVFIVSDEVVYLDNRHTLHAVLILCGRVLMTP